MEIISNWTPLIVYIYGRPTQCMRQILQSVSVNLGLQYPSSVVYRSPKHRNHSTSNRPTATVGYPAATVQCLGIHPDSPRGTPQLIKQREDGRKVSITVRRKEGEKIIIKNHPLHHAMTHSTEPDPVSTCPVFTACDSAVLTTVPY